MSLTITILATKPGASYTAPGGSFLGCGPQPTTIQLQRQEEGGKVSWWMRWGIIGTREANGHVRTDTCAYGGGQRYKSRKLAREAFARCPEGI